MFDPTLPKDLHVRPANRDDAQAIANINMEYELAETGTAESTVSDVFELWDSERMVLVVSIIDAAFVVSNLVSIRRARRVRINCMRRWV